MLHSVTIYDPFFGLGSISSGSSVRFACLQQGQKIPDSLSIPFCTFWYSPLTCAGVSNVLWGCLLEALASAMDWYQLAIPLESIILKWSESDGWISSQTAINDKSLLMLKTSCWACSINFSLSPTQTPTFSKISLLFLALSGEFSQPHGVCRLLPLTSCVFRIQDILDFLRCPSSLFSMGYMYYIFANPTLASTQNKATTKQNHVALHFKIWWPRNLICPNESSQSKKTLLGPEHILLNKCWGSAAGRIWKPETIVI